jgi:exopolysaccharide biosynthesis WecB/TagA/CpsF family protein
MSTELSLIKLDNFFKSKPGCEIRKTLLMYVDFNVANILFEQKLCLTSETRLYYDSTLMHIALRLLGYKNLPRQVSTDLQLNLLERINNRGNSVFLFGDKKDVLLNVRSLLEKEYTGIRIFGLSNGYDFSNDELIRKINDTAPDYLFVGLGAGRQEKWVLQNSKKLKCKNILTVGGWFKYLSGDKKRAPLSLRKLHLEWLFKLSLEFRLFGRRYFIGSLKFMYRVFVSKGIILKIND